jgi:hypothetical protein
LPLSYFTGQLARIVLKIRMRKQDMGTRSKILSCSVVLFTWVLLCTGCSYLVKNGRQSVYSKSQYGIDKFVVVAGRHIHYVEVGE